MRMLVSSRPNSGQTILLECMLHLLMGRDCKELHLTGYSVQSTSHMIARPFLRGLFLLHRPQASDREGKRDDLDLRSEGQLLKRGSNHPVHAAAARAPTRGNWRLSSAMQRVLSMVPGVWTTTTWSYVHHTPIRYHLRYTTQWIGGHGGQSRVFAAGRIYTETPNTAVS